MKKFTISLSALLLTFLISFPAYSQSNLPSEISFAFGKTLYSQNNYSGAKIELQNCLKINQGHVQAKKLLRLCEEKIKEGEKDRAMQLTLNNAEEEALLKQKALENKTRLKQTPGGETELTAEELSLEPPTEKGAWTLKKGQLYMEMYTKYFWNNAQFNNDRKKQRWDYNGKSNEIRAEYKLEYGLIDQCTLLLNTVAKDARWKDDFNSYSKRGFTEIWPGIKYLIFTKPFICSLQAKAKFPFDYDEHTTPSLGPRTIDGEFKILTAQPWPKLPGYTKLEVGFRGRTQKPANELPYYFELGYNLTPKIIFKTTIDGFKGVDGTGDIESLTKYTGSWIIKLTDRFNIEFGYGDTFYGKNTSAGREIYTTISSLW